MRFDAVIELGAEVYSQDVIGQQIAIKTWRQVYANEFTLSRAEYYEAGAQGLKPECQYQIRSCEYQDEQLMRAGDVEYNIIRVERRGEWTRLTGERVVGNG